MGFLYLIGILLGILLIAFFVIVNVKKDVHDSSGVKIKRQDISGEDISGHDVMMEPNYEKPYSTTPIDNVDDYEYNLVFQNEGDRGITKAQRDYLMSQYPMDWSVQPPSSVVFQKGLSKFKEAFENPAPPQQGNPYKEIDGTLMTPPDTLSVEMKEREILNTYVPKKPQELTTYDAADAKDLIHKIYDAKGQVADFFEKKPGVFVVTGTRRKDEKIVYEDEDVGVASQDPVKGNGEVVLKDPLTPAVGEGMIVVPPSGYDSAVGLDPFFTAGAKTRDGKWDYTSWTPGLERMFAPNAPLKNWY